MSFRFLELYPGTCTALINYPDIIFVFYDSLNVLPALLPLFGAAPFRQPRSAPRERRRRLRLRGQLPLRVHAAARARPQGLQRVGQGARGDHGVPKGALSDRDCR